MIKIRYSLPALLLALLVTNLVYSQPARTSIGIGAGINRPFKSGYGLGRDRVLQANIRLNNNLALMPLLGWETIAGGKNINDRSGFDAGFLNLAAKYFVSKNVFTYAGPSVYVGGSDGGVVGLGGSAGAGYNWNLDDYSSLEFSLRADALPTHLQAGTLIGLRVAYQFNFKPW
ncbi:hypothetical protein MUGA111182_03645 [Mucilaginibacter galii]|uniref:hypothetical protein n=1 Tax=Mucilaginibacter galii TaxID=2005073 RepID=UPI00166BC8DE|nr:hypothetical protein [Mucilaginibacter galii]